MKRVAESLRLPSDRTAANLPGIQGGAPVPNAIAKPNPAQTPAHPAAQAAAHAAAAPAQPGRNAPGAAPASAPHRAVPSKTNGNAKGAGQAPGSAKTAARRDAHIGHAAVAPAGRERGGGYGGFGGHGKPDIQDWMPFSAQQSRIARMARPHPGPGLTKVIAHPVHPLRAVVYSVASRLYSEVLPSLFGRTPREAERNDRAIRKDLLRKDAKQKSERNEARQEAVRQRAEANPNRVLAGDLTTAFASK